MRFQGTATYVAGDELKTAVNAAIALERPLLVKGEPGTGKTLLAQEIAGALGARSSPGTSNRRPARSRASTNMTPSRGFAIRSSAIRGSRTSPIISGAASCGRPSARPFARCC